MPLVDVKSGFLMPRVSITSKFRLTVAAAAVLGATLAAAGSDSASHAYTPVEALGLLRAGNDRFVRNASTPVSLSVNRRQELAAGQHPATMVLSCADSRVPPEHVFNVGLGDLFVIRTAGAVVDKSILATLESGAEHLHIPLLVVMGYESCDAVTAIQPKTAPRTPHAPLRQLHHGDIW